ncbi:hypothetical protein MOVS_05210 [Moraxella ovis]|uniref:N4-gp56 family major capsid protein n=1 Tax=Moraxella ovis TaxID=29433 RepID=A0A378PK08_9GAMM|nr:N4-gp56 family major capsid protein [Moraxella ovis]ANB91477.1 hypothetical protein MOVS_05210 [Moraxella ovis]STY87095.1 Uncharacterised protein [Moraxella ovis]
MHVYGNEQPPVALKAQQLQPYAFERKALIDARKEQYFGQLSNTKAMPKNSGKTIKQYHYLPILDDRNINDMGLDAAGSKYANGNLYGSSKDVGTIPSKFPVLSETGGKVNRVGVTRRTIESNLEKFGFYTDFSTDLLAMDSDAELLSHITRELMNAAVEIQEDLLQKDLLNAAGTVRYAGTATNNDTLDETSVLTYNDLMRLTIDLDNARCPKQTTIITGTRLIDTKTIPSCRVAYVGSELIPTLEAMEDLHNRPALVPVQQYAAGTTVLNGEYGTIAGFRIVVVPEMMKWAGRGATGLRGTFYATGGKFDVFPFLVVGGDSFVDIGFQTDGKSNKFKTIMKKGDELADMNNPYGDVGFSSIKWWYGFMALRPEWIGLIKCTAKL